MIKISLLSTSEVRNKLELFEQLRIGLIALILIIAVIIFMSFSIKGKIEAKDKELETLEIELQRLQKAGVEKLDKEHKRKKKELETKIDVIWDLKSRQAGPVHLLDGMSRGLPDRVWLSSMEESAKGVRIKGYAYTNVDVARFMTNLERMDYFSDVELIQSGQSKVGEHKIMVFSLNMRYHAPKGWEMKEEQKSK